MKLHILNTQNALKISFFIEAISTEQRIIQKVKKRRKLINHTNLYIPTHILKLQLYCSFYIPVKIAKF